MKYLITGAAGFIGINFLEYMINAHINDEFVLIDKLTYAANEDHFLKILKENKAIVFYKTDICNSKSINKIFEKEKPNIVVNFAAETHVDRSIKNPKIFVKTNILGTNILLEASKKFGVKKYIQISTDEVYGSLDKDTFNIKSEFNIDDLLKPNNPYSATKASADLLVTSYSKTYHLPTNIIRMTNNFGPYQNKEKLIPKTILNAINKKQIPLYKDGSNLRDWLYVKDSVKAIDLIINNGEIDKIYHISTHNLLSNYDLIKMILKKLNASEKLIKNIADRPAHDYAYSLNTKETEKIGFKINADFDKNLNETIEFYKNESNMKL